MMFCSEYFIFQSRKSFTAEPVVVTNTIERTSGMLGACGFMQRSKCVWLHSGQCVANGGQYSHGAPRQDCQERGTPMRIV